MSCFICATKFNWRRKELDCKNCQKAVCKQCLSQKLVIPKFGPKEIPVCIKCFNDSKKVNNVSKSSNNGGSEPPPSYDEPSQYFGPSMKDLVAPKSQHPKVPPQLNPDAKLRERLNQLKEKPAPPAAVSQAEIEEKFQNVAGRSAASSSTGKPNVLTPLPKLTEAEEIRKLLEQSNAQVELDKAYAEGVQEKVDDMEKRLYKLKGEDPEKVNERKQQPTTYLDSSSEDEDKAIDKIMKKCTFVPSVEPGEPSLTYGSVKKEEDEEEELPWCCICNDDASIRCHDCDEDLYCRRCFKEGHNDHDTKGHANSAYKKKLKR